MFFFQNFKLYWFDNSCRNFDGKQARCWYKLESELEELWPILVIIKMSRSRVKKRDCQNYFLPECWNWEGEGPDLGVWVCWGGGGWLPDQSPLWCLMIGGDTPDLGLEGEGDFGALAKGHFGTLVSTLGPRPICLYLGKFLIFYLMLFYLEQLWKSF